MTGFDYDGETYDGGSWDEEAAPKSVYIPGEYDGTHWDADPAQGQTWVIGDQQITVVGVEITPTELSLDVRARTDSERRLLSTLDDNAGAFEDRTLADGTYQARDTAAGNNTFTIRPPTRLKPPRIVRDWLVDDVSRTRTSSDQQTIEATVTFVASQTRVPVVGYTDPSNTSEWSFAFADGTVVTASVADLQQGETTTIPLVLTDRQAELVESTVAAVGGSYTFEVPDGGTFTRDETPESRQSVTITVPDTASGAPIDSGEYVVTGWRSRGSDGAGFRFELEVSTRYRS